jgi:hypothetical protein
MDTTSNCKRPTRPDHSSNSTSINSSPLGYELTAPLLLKTAEVCRLLGDIHPRTLSRLEARGLIVPVSGLLRHKLYARRDVEALVENLSRWKP